MGQSRHRSIVLAGALLRFGGAATHDNAAAVKPKKGMQGSAHPNRNSGIKLPKSPGAPMRINATGRTGCVAMRPLSASCSA